jgi:very-short-patch-repair endonuclease
MNKNEIVFESYLRSKRLVFEKEYRFDSSRRWRFDYAIPAWKIAVEIEGGVWSGGRHTSGAGFTKDCEKYNSATCHGWKVLRFTTSQFTNGDYARFIEEIIK